MQLSVLYALITSVGVLGNAANVRRGDGGKQSHENHPRQLPDDDIAHPRRQYIYTGKDITFEPIDYNTVSLVPRPNTTTASFDTIEAQACLRSWADYSTRAYKTIPVSCRTTEILSNFGWTRSALGNSTSYTLPCETGITRVNFTGSPTATITSRLEWTKVGDLWNDSCSDRYEAKPACTPNFEYRWSTCKALWSNYIQTFSTMKDQFDLEAYRTMSGFKDLDECDGDTRDMCEVDTGTDVMLM